MDGQSKIEFPYIPPDEYDFRVEFTMSGGSGIVTQIMPKPDATKDDPDEPQGFRGAARHIVWGMWQQEFGLEDYTAGDDVKKRIGRPVHYGDRLTMVVKIRKDGIKGYVNGDLAVDYKNSPDRVAGYAGWQLRDPRRLGVGTGSSTIMFHRIDVREVSGPGTKLDE